MDRERRILIYLKRREIYLLEKLLEFIKRGEFPDSLLGEMEEERRKRARKEMAKRIGRDSLFPGFLVLFSLLILMGLFSLKKPVSPPSFKGGAFIVGKPEKLLVSYYFDSGYLELVGYDWSQEGLSMEERAELQDIQLYYSLGGLNIKKGEKILRELLARTGNPKVKSRILLALASLKEREGDRKRALIYARTSLSLASPYPPLTFDPLSYVLKLLWEENRFAQMGKYIPRSLELLNYDFYYPLFKYTSFYILWKEREENLRTRWVFEILSSLAQNFPSNLKLANDFATTFKKCSAPLCYLALGITYRSLGFREYYTRFLNRFLSMARRNPAKYSGFIILAKRLKNAP